MGTVLIKNNPDTIRYHRLLITALQEMIAEKEGAARDWQGITFDDDDEDLPVATSSSEPAENAAEVNGHDDGEDDAAGVVPAISADDDWDDDGDGADVFAKAFEAVVPGGADGAPPVSTTVDDETVGDEAVGDEADGSAGDEDTSMVGGGGDSQPVIEDLDDGFVFDMDADEWGDVSSDESDEAAPANGGADAETGEAETEDAEHRDAMAADTMTADDAASDDEMLAADEGGGAGEWGIVDALHDDDDADFDVVGPEDREAGLVDEMTEHASDDDGSSKDTHPQDAADAFGMADAAAEDEEEGDGLPPVADVTDEGVIVFPDDGEGETGDVRSDMDTATETAATSHGQDEHTWGNDLLEEDDDWGDNVLLGDEDDWDMGDVDDEPEWTADEGGVAKERETPDETAGLHSASRESEDARIETGAGVAGSGQDAPDAAVQVSDADVQALWGDDADEGMGDIAHDEDALLAAEDDLGGVLVVGDDDDGEDDTPSEVDGDTLLTDDDYDWMLDEAAVDDDDSDVVGEISNAAAGLNDMGAAAFAADTGADDDGAVNADDMEKGDGEEGQVLAIGAGKPPLAAGDADAIFVEENVEDTPESEMPPVASPDTLDNLSDEVLVGDVPDDEVDSRVDDALIDTALADLPLFGAVAQGRASQEHEQASPATSLAAESETRGDLRSSLGVSASGDTEAPLAPDAGEEETPVVEADSGAILIGGVADTDSVSPDADGQDKDGLLIGAGNDFFDVEEDDAGDDGLVIANDYEELMSTDDETAQGVVIGGEANAEEADVTAAPIDAHDDAGGLDDFANFVVDADDAFGSEPHDGNGMGAGDGATVEAEAVGERVTSTSDAPHADGMGDAEDWALDIGLGDLAADFADGATMTTVGHGESDGDGALASGIDEVDPLALYDDSPLRLDDTPDERLDVMADDAVRVQGAKAGMAGVVSTLIPDDGEALAPWDDADDAQTQAFAGGDGAAETEELELVLDDDEAEEQEAFVAIEDAVLPAESVEADQDTETRDYEILVVPVE